MVVHVFLCNNFTTLKKQLVYKNWLTLIKIEIMENSVLIIVAVVFLVFLLILYFVKQNKKDKKELEKILNNDYKKMDKSDDN